METEIRFYYSPNSEDKIINDLKKIKVKLKILLK